MAKAADVYFQVDPWKIIEEGFDPAYSRVSESVFSLANESLGVRGCFDEGGSADSLRGAYVNGVYDVERLNRSYRGIIDQTHFMIPAADWLMTDLVLDGERLDLGKSLFRDFKREMDMRRGTLKRSFVWRTASGKELRLTFLRFLDMTHRERAYQRVAMEPLNFSGTVDFVSGLSFDVIHEGYKKCYWRDARVEAFENRLMLQSHTTLSGQEVFAGALLNMPPDAAVRKDGQTVSLRAALPLEQGRETHVDKRVVILFDGQAGGALWQSGMAALAESERISLDEALAAQQTYWGDYWRTSDVQIEAAPGNEAVVAAEQQGIRFCSFQLAQIYSGSSMRHNIGAKGLTGEVPALLSVYQSPGGAVPAPVPLQHAAPGVGAGQNAGLRRRLLSAGHAERRRGLLPVAACQPAIAAQHRRGLRHLALCPCDGRSGFPVCLRSRDAGADRPVPRQPRGKRRKDG